MSLQEDKPQQGTLQEVAARIIQKTWRGYMASEVFRYFKELIFYCKQQDPKTILKTVNPREAELLDAAAGVFIRFRLGGINFPPDIYYKIFTHRPITDVCAGSPKDYTKQSRRKLVAQKTNKGPAVAKDDRSGWYKRMENNSWRLFCNKVVLAREPAEIGADKKMDFHYSKLQRKQDLESWRKRKKIEWLKQMYKEGHLQDHAEHRHMAALVESSAQELMETVEKKGDDEILEWELDELLAWTNTLNFEEYMEEWRHLACSYSSELSKVSPTDGPSHPPRLDPHELADENAAEQT
ncbi:protein MFI isoform X2 [Astatotilapia calliptera]|uniref:protein MFI isoform X2 n=1 Tax=Astatotilapia calliptera TaxID=8154 RepID=UPI000E427644|nr:uncharacterized protein C11orf65 homolog isoform X2 [Astatotilapia calliptera]